MAAGAFAVARRYILYREARARRREEQALRLRDADGQEVLLNLALLRSWIAEACAGYEDRVSAKAIAEEVLAGLPAGAPLADLERSIVLAARTRIEHDPAYSFVAARALLRGLYAEALGRRVGIDETRAAYPLAFVEYVRRGVELELLAPEMLDFDLERLGAALAPERDLAFQYLGLQTLYDRYLIHHERTAHRAAADALDAGRHGSRPAGGGARGAGHRLLRPDLVVPLLPLDAHPLQRRHALPAALLVLPLDRRRRPRGDLQDGARQRPPLQVERRHRQRLDPGARPRQPHQGHQRRQPGRRPLPQGRQRHRHRGQSGRQAQGRRLRLPRGLAPRRRGVPRPAQEHRRRPPPHPRHAHRLVDSRSLHAAGGGRRRLDALQPERRPRPARPLRRCLRPALRRVRSRGRPGRDRQRQTAARGRSLAGDADRALRDRSPLDHLQGRGQRAQPAGPRRGRPQLESLHRDPAQHQPGRGRRLQPGLGQPRRPRQRRGDRPRPAAGDGAASPCACSTT